VSSARWITPRDATLLGALVGALSMPFLINAQTTELDPLVGRDLWKDPLPQRQQLRLDQAIGKVPKGVMMEPTPWHVWKTDHNGVARYVVLLGEPEMIIPGGSSACVFLFEGASKLINNWCFPTGYRITLDSASFEFSTDLGSDVISLHMVRFINGRNVAKEYFAINGDRLRFIRMENDKGEAVQNEYVFPNVEIGIVPAGSTEDEWIGMLQSSDKTEVLSALLFLGGRHITESKRHFAPEPAESKYAGLFQQLVGSPRIHELIVGLSSSDNEWIRQAALLAARGPRERLLQ
jgi:hypothetical protein